MSFICRRWRPWSRGKMFPGTRRWVALRQELLATPHGRARLLAGRPRVEGVAWMDQFVAEVQQVRVHVTSAKCVCA